MDFSSEWSRKALAAGAIMLTLLSYGVVQERIMTQPYGVEQERFKNAAYLVLNNRVVAIFIAIAMIWYNNEKVKNAAPIPNFFGVSISNTIATLCQYGKKLPHHYQTTQMPFYSCDILRGSALRKLPNSNFRQMRKNDPCDDYWYLHFRKEIWLARVWDCWRRDNRLCCFRSQWGGELFKIPWLAIS